MKNTFKILAILTSCIAISSCQFLEKISSQKSNKSLAALDYLDKAPKFNIKNFFNGNLEGFAVIKNENGKIENSFVLDVDGKWEGDKGTVRYNYVFNGGKKDSRTWLFTVDDAENYTAIGHDFISPAKGRQAGNVSQILYTLIYPHKDKKQNVDFEDNIYLIDENSVIIISEMFIGKNKIGTATIALKKINK